TAHEGAGARRFPRHVRRRRRRARARRPAPCARACRVRRRRQAPRGDAERHRRRDRKSTRLNSSHVSISYAVFCLKKKNTKIYRDSLCPYASYSLPDASRHFLHASPNVTLVIILSTRILRLLLFLLLIACDPLMIR